MRRREFLRASSRAALGASLGLIASRVHGGAAQPKGSRSISADAIVAGLERRLPELLTEMNVPGVSAAIVIDGKRVWRRGFGVRDRATKQPVDDATIFEAASVSKTVFAYVVLELAERGIIGLDTPLTRYAPEPFLEGDPRLGLITARHVLSHTSGFQDWRSGSAPLKIHFQPGEKFQYSGEGYFYLQSVVSHLTGRTDRTDCAKYEADLEVCATDIDAYIKRVLLRPFGMEASGYLWNERLAAHAAQPHDVDGKPQSKSRPKAPDVARYASAGGLHTTAGELAQFLIEVVAPKPATEFRLGQPMWKEMLRPQIQLDPQEKIDGANAWALGWAVQERPTGNVIVHSGGQNGFRSLVMASVERKSGFVLLTNGDTGGKLLYDPKLGEILTPLLAG